MAHGSYRPGFFAKAVGLTALAIGTLAGAGLAPEPSPVPRRWELKVDVGPLRVTSVNVNGQPRAFMYLTYRVVNKSGEDLLFAPSFEMTFGTQKPVRAGRDVPAEVTSALIAKLEDPFVQDQISIIGQILQGEENARDGVVIWPAESLDPTKLTMYAAGFSGETATVELPSQTEGKAKEKAVLRKTLMVTYSTGGELTGRGDKPVEVAERRWIMR
jgi:hypothetical protein